MYFDLIDINWTASISTPINPRIYVVYVANFSYDDCWLDDKPTSDFLQIVEFL